MNSIDDFLTSMTAPSLESPNFSSEFSEWTSAIEENIKKLVSAPYLKGDRGNSIESISVDLGGDNPIATKLLDGIKDAINDAFRGDCENDKLGDQDDNPNPNSIDSISDKTIVLYKDDAESKLFITNPFFFIDARRNFVNDNPGNHEIARQFIDKTSIITGVGTYNEGEYDWEIQVHKIIPTLYFDEEVRQYCWSVNGELTGIIAQGVRGDNGQNANSIAICKGDLSVNRIDIEEVFNSGLEVTGDSGSDWISVEESDIKEGDIAIVFHDSDDVQGCAFGLIYKESEDDGSSTYFIKYTEDIDIVRIIQGQSLRGLLNTIGNNPNGVRGLFSPSNDKGAAHMIWEEDGEFNVGQVDYDHTYSNISSPTPSQNTTLNIQYTNTNVKHKLNIDEETRSFNDISDGKSQNYIISNGSDDLSVIGERKINRQTISNGDVYKSLLPSFDIKFSPNRTSGNNYVEVIEHPSECIGVYLDAGTVSGNNKITNILLRLKFKNVTTINTYNGDKLLDSHNNEDVFTISISDLYHENPSEYIGVLSDQYIAGYRCYGSSNLNHNNYKSYLLQLITEVSPILSYYMTGSEYNKKFPLINLPKTTNQSTNLNSYYSHRAIDICDYYSHWTVTNNSNYLLRSREDCQTKITETNTYKGLLTLKTPWVGLSNGNDIYEGQHLKNSDGSDNIDIELSSWKSNLSSNYKGIQWGGNRLHSHSKDLRVLYYTDSEEQKYAVNLQTDVIRVNFGSISYFDIVYKLSDISNSGWTTNSKPIKRFLKDYLGMQDSYICHFIVTHDPAVSSSNGVSIRNNSFASTSMPVGMIWYKVTQNTTNILDSTYSVANSNSNIILKSDNKLSKTYTDKVLYIKDLLENTTTSTNIKDPETYTFNSSLTGISNPIKVYPKSGLFVDEAPVRLDDKLNGYSSQSYNINDNVQLSITPNTAYGIQVSYIEDDVTTTIPTFNASYTTSTYNYGLNLGNGTQIIIRALPTLTQNTTQIIHNASNNMMRPAILVPVNPSDFSNGTLKCMVNGDSATQNSDGSFTITKSEGNMNIVLSFVAGVNQLLNQPTNSNGLQNITPTIGSSLNNSSNSEGVEEITYSDNVEISLKVSLTEPIKLLNNIRIWSKVGSFIDHPTANNITIDRQGPLNGAEYKIRLEDGDEIRIVTRNIELNINVPSSYIKVTERVNKKLGHTERTYTITKIQDAPITGDKVITCAAINKKSTTLVVDDNIDMFIDTKISDNETWYCTSIDGDPTGDGLGEEIGIDYNAPTPQFAECVLTRRISGVQLDEIVRPTVIVRGIRANHSRRTIMTNYSSSEAAPFQISISDPTTKGNYIEQTITIIPNDLSNYGDCEAYYIEFSTIDSSLTTRQEINNLYSRLEKAVASAELAATQAKQAVIDAKYTVATSSLTSTTKATSADSSGLTQK